MSAMGDDEIEAMLTETEQYAALSPWEREFVESVREQWDSRGELSQKQLDKLQQIHADRG